MKTQLIETYHKCRKEKPFMLSGQDAICSLEMAKTILAFRDAESDGLVRLRYEAEQENYFDVFGRDGTPAELKRQEEIIERLGCWWTCSEWFDGNEWHQADSCGMHTGYKNVLDPFENCYIVDHMRAAFNALKEHQTTLRETELAECYP